MKKIKIFSAHDFDKITRKNAKQSYSAVKNNTFEIVNTDY